MQWIYIIRRIGSKLYLIYKVVFFLVAIGRFGSALLHKSNAHDKTSSNGFVAEQRGNGKTVPHL